ncbi:MAG: hypothetical protein Q9209_004566 [Squamulea sp. 1 TL-2023]
MGGRKARNSSSKGGTSGDSGKKGGGGEQGRQQDAAQVNVASSSVPRPNLEVTKAEDTQLKQLQLARPTVIAKYPIRPAYGTEGKNVTLRANCFELVPPAKLILHRYDVEVKGYCIEKGERKEKDIVGKKLVQAFRLILEVPQLRNLRNDLVTDFKSQLLSRAAFDAELLQAFPLEIPYLAEGEDDPRANAPTLIVKISAIGPVTVSELTDYLTSTDTRGSFDKQPILQALNIFVGHYSKQCSDLAKVGSKSFPVRPHQNDTRSLEAGLVAIRGFFSSVRVATTRILVNVNVTHAPFYNAVPLKQSIEAFQRAQKGEKDKRSKLQPFLKRVRVAVTHIKRKNKFGQVVPIVKTIFALATRNDGHGPDAVGPPPEVSDHGAGPANVKFWLSEDSNQKSSSPSVAARQSQGPKDKIMSASKARSSGQGSGGRYVSVADYFMTKYHIQTDHGLPVVNVGTTARPSYLPAEVCEILPGQSYQGRLEPEQTQKMIQFAVRKPQDNAISIEQDGPNVVGLSPHIDRSVSRFGVAVDNTMITVPGRILVRPDFRYGGQKPNIKSAQWNMIGVDKKLLKGFAGASLRSWQILVVVLRGAPSSLDPKLTEQQKAMLHTALVDFGIKVAKVAPVSAITINGPDDPLLQEAIRNASSKSQVCIIALPSTDKALFDRIKTIADTKSGLHTVCVVGKKFAKDDPSYMANLALKINLKLGGVNQQSEDKKLGIILEGKTMIVGIDVTHPSPGSASTAPSVAGMVASVTRDLGQWPAIMRVQKAGAHEMISDLTMMLRSRLNLWKQNNKQQLPRNILIYRDGVSEGEYDLVLQKELPLLREAYKDLYSKMEGPPKITIVIVGKRHHLRFFPTADDDPEVTDLDTGNPINGTVVDRHVTEVQNWEFFLQSHKTLKGTARPAHYFVVLDEIFTKHKLPQGSTRNQANDLENLTHSLCYLYGRAMTAVSICTPVYYAHLACERARCYLSTHYSMPVPEPGQNPPPTPTSDDVQVHPTLKDKMFYI